EFLRNAPHAGVESETGFNTDHEQVERVGQAQEDLLLPAPNLEFEDDLAQIEAEASADDERRKPLELNAVADEAVGHTGQSADDQHRGLDREEDLRGTGTVIPGVGQPDLECILFQFRLRLE